MKLDVGIELKMLSIDTGIPLEGLIQDYWRKMLETGHLEDPIARETLVVNCIANTYLSDPISYG